MKCETIPELEKFLTIQEQALGQNSPEVAATVSKLADLYFNKGMLENAEALYRRALGIMEKTLGPYRIEVSDAKKSLEKVLTEKQRSTIPPSGRQVNPSNSSSNSQSSSHVQSSSTGQQLLYSQRMDRQLTVLDSSTSLDAVPASAALGWPSGFGKGEDYEKEAEIELASVRQTMGKDHPHVADCLTKLADQYCRRKKYREMEPILQEALRIREKCLGLEHPMVSTSLKNLARLYYFQARYELSEPLFKRALAIRQKVYGKGHSRYADVEEQYAKLLRKTGRAMQAQELENNVRIVRARFNAQGT
jgi:tetratricopeptide (TPR) repeat protein